MGWIFLLVSVCFECSWASTLKYTEGYSRLWPSVGNILLGIGGVITLSTAVKTLPLSTAYCVWTGISAVVITIMGKVLFGEQLTLVHVGFIGLIIIGVIGLKFLSAA